VREVVIGADEATLYLTTTAGNLHALDAATGAIEWSAAAGTAVSSRPAVADGVVYLGTADGRVLAFAADGCGQPTCTPLWDAPVGGSVGGQPTVAGGVVFVGTAAGTVVALDGAGCGGPTCAPIWSETVGTGVVSKPIVSAGRLLVGNAGTTVAFTPTA
jgi:outer membrane protein assembly factor BamB